LKKIFYTLIIIAIISSCDEDSKCNNCGDIYGGYITMKVTANDLTKYQGLAQFDNIDELFNNSKFSQCKIINVSKEKKVC